MFTGLVLIAYAQMPIMKAHADISNGATCRRVYEQRSSGGSVHISKLTCTGTYTM